MQVSVSEQNNTGRQLLTFTCCSSRAASCAQHLKAQSAWHVKLVVHALLGQIRTAVWIRLQAFLPCFLEPCYNAMLKADNMWQLAPATAGHFLNKVAPCRADLYSFMFCCGQAAQRHLAPGRVFM